jgi:hypothetical protein
MFSVDENTSSRRVLPITALRQLVSDSFSGAQLLLVTQ